MTDSARQPTVWVVNQVDALPGEGFKLNRYPRLAAAFADQGIDVTWFTGTFSHYSFSRRTLSKGVLAALPYKIELVRNRPYSPGITWSRFQNHRDFSHGFEARAREATRARPHLIICSLPTIEGTVAAASVARTLGAKLVIDVRDPWPDTFTGLVSWPLKFPMAIAAMLLRKRVRTVLRRADAVLAVSQTYARWAERIAGVLKGPVLVAPLGTDLDFIDGEEDRAAPVYQRTIEIAYVGALGASFDWPTLAKAIPLVVESERRARFRIIGVGRRTAAIQKALRQSSVLASAVELPGQMPHKDVMKQLASSDIGLHSFVPRATNSITNKFIDYLAAGLPVVNSLPGEVADLVTENGVGLNYTAGDSQGLAHAILALCADEAQRARMRRGAIHLAHQFDANVIYTELARALIGRLLPNH